MLIFKTTSFVRGGFFYLLLYSSPAATQDKPSVPSDVASLQVQGSQVQGSTFRVKGKALKTQSPG